jgi:uncharacterized membrane protein
MFSERTKIFITGLIAGLFGISLMLNPVQAVKKETPENDNKKEWPPVGMTCYLVGTKLIKYKEETRQQLEEQKVYLKHKYEAGEINQETYERSIENIDERLKTIKENETYLLFKPEKLELEEQYVKSLIDNRTYKRKLKVIEAKEAYYNCFGYTPNQEKHIEKLNRMFAKGKITPEKYDNELVKYLNRCIEDSRGDKDTVNN